MPTALIRYVAAFAMLHFMIYGHFNGKSHGHK